MDKKKELQDLLGFSEKKAAIYLALLEYGEMGTAQIAKRTHLKRTTVYNILPELVSEGFIAQAKHSGKTTFFINNVHDIERHIAEKTEKTKQLITELQKNIGLFDVQPKVLVYEGLGGAKKLYQDVTDSVASGDTILTFIGTHAMHTYIPKDVIASYVDQRIKKNVYNHIITSSEDASLEWSKRAAKELREVRFIPFLYPSVTGDIKLYGNFIAFVSYKENFFGMIIESPEMSQLLKNMFHALWSSIE